MRAQLIGVAKQTSKKFLTLTITSVVAFSGLAMAAPLFFAGSAAAAGVNDVYINEVSPSSTTEWVELYNSSSSSVDISGWHIRTTANSSGNFGGVIPSNTTIPGHGYYVQTGTGFLTNTGTTVKICVDSNCTQTGDSLAYPGGLSATQSYGRSTNGGTSLSLFSSPTQGGSNDPAAELSVCANSSSCDFSDIGEAVSSIADGGTVYVGSGNYEGFSVNGKTNVTIQGNGVGNTNVVPTSLVNTTIGHKYTADMKVSVLVVDSTNLNIGGMTIGDGGLSADAVVLWDASSGTIGNSNVTGSTTAVNISGTQTGQGVAVDGGTTDLTISNVNISGFQKNGVDIEDGNDGTTGAGNISVTISGGSVTGVGATSANAQNGIVAWNQAGGSVNATVNGTVISDLDFTDPSNTASGVLAFGSANITSVSNTSFNNVQTYIANAPGGSAVDATTGNSFDGVSPATASTSQLTNIEKNLYGTTEDASSKPIYLLPNTLIVTTDSSNLGIQSAVNAAPSGDTVYVLAGDYTGQGTISVTNNVTIKGAQAGVDARTRSVAASEETKVVGFNVTNANVTIDGFKVDPGAGGQDTGIRLSGTSGSNAVRNNIITDYQSSGVFWATGTGTFDLSKNLFSNTTGSDSDGFQAQNGVTSSVNSTFEDNTFTTASVGGADIQLSFGDATGTVISGNTSTGGATLATLFNMTGSQVLNNSFAGDQSYSGSIIYVGGGDSNTTISGNTLSGSAGGAVAVSNAFGYGVNAGTTITDNTITNSVRGLSIGVGSINSTETVTAHHNAITGNTLGARNQSSGNLDASQNWWGSANPDWTAVVSNTGSGTLNHSPWWGANYVGDSHTSAWNWYADGSIQSAVNTASDGDTVNVLSGDYSSAGTITLNHPITLAGVQTGKAAANTSNGNQRTGSETTLSRVYITSGSVTVDGFNFNSNSTSGQLQVLSGSTLSGITVENNIFSGYKNVALPTNGAGNIKIQNNLFTSPSGSAEAMQIKTSGNAGDCSGTQVLNNVFTAATTNGAADINLSCTGSNSTNVTVSGNRSMNASDPNGPNLAAFSGVNGGITVSGNTASTSGSQVLFFGSVSGSASISGNTFTGSGGSAVSIYGGDFPYFTTGDTANTGNFSIDNNDLSGNSHAISVSTDGLSGSGTLTASGNNLTGETGTAVRNSSSLTLSLDANWWGNALGPTSSQYSGSVSSWCTSTPTVGSACSATQTASSGSTSLPSGPISAPTVSGNTASITVPSSNSVVATTSTSAGTVQVTIPAGTTVTADSSSWDGTIEAPTVTSVNLGSSKNVSLAIEVGAGNTSLTFDNAVRLVLPGQAGKSVGFVRNNVFTAITDACSADSQAVGNALAAGGNCYVNVGSDLVVWTKHFTTFVAYTPASSSNGSSGTSNGSTSSNVATTSSSAPSSSTNGSGAGSVQGASTSTTAGKTSSTSVEAPVANASQPKVAAHEAGGIRWYWWVVMAVIALAAIGFGVYRYADGTDKN